MAHAHAVRTGPQDAVHRGRGRKRAGNLGQGPGRGLSQGSGQGPVRNLVTVAAAAEKGISKLRADRLFRRIAATSPLPMGKLRAQLIPDSTWKRAGKALGPQASQTVARLEHALSFAEKVWGNDTDAMEWLTSPHMELQDATPFSKLKTEAGGRAVEWILAALEYGFPV
jgi:putative toxin-antitoxin system antitoxin component (TIGR02293 family)